MWTEVVPERSHCARTLNLYHQMAQSMEICVTIESNRPSGIGRWFGWLAGPRAKPPVAQTSAEPHETAAEYDPASSAPHPPGAAANYERPISVSAGSPSPEKSREKDPPATPSVVVVAIVKNEARYLLEWIAYHRTVGIDHFIILDNESTDGTYFLLQPLADAGLITYFRWDLRQTYPGFGTVQVGPQVPAYNFALHLARNLGRWEWIGFIDLDEFVLPTETDNIGDVLSGFSAFGAVGANWRMFGSSGHLSEPQGLVIENFTRCSLDGFSANKHVKSFAQISKLQQAGTHIPQTLTDHVVDMAARRISPERHGVHDAVVYDKLVINHYFTKSFEEWSRKRIKGNVASRITRSNWDRPPEMFAEYDRNEREDRAILKYVPAVRQAISELNSIIRNFPNEPASAGDPEERASLFRTIAAEAKTLLATNPEEFVSNYAKLLQKYVDQIDSFPFDADWYVLLYPDVVDAVAAGKASSPYEHFVTSGFPAGRIGAPMPADELWYSSINRDVDRAVSEGRIASTPMHFRRWGFFEGRVPSELHRVDKRWYETTYASVSWEIDFGLFSSPQDHYNRRGYALGFWPSEESFAISTGQKWPWDERSGSSWRFAGPHPKEMPAHTATSFVRQSDAISSSAPTSGPATEISFVGNLGEAFDREPDNDFSEIWYLSQNQDVATAVRAGRLPNAYAHYRRYGKAEGRTGKPPNNLSAAEMRSHRDARYLAPDDLSVSGMVPKHVVIVGSCLTESWRFHLANPTGTKADLLQMNNLSRMPKTSIEAIANYDFQVVQIPLRSVMSGDRLWKIAADDDDGHERLFQECCAGLKRILVNWMEWNTKYGLLTFVANFMVPQQNPLGRLARRYHLSNVEYFVEQINRRLEELVSGHKNAYIVDIDRMSASLGRRFVQDDSVTGLSHSALFPDWRDPGARIEPLPHMTWYYDIHIAEFREVLWAEMVAMFRTIRQVDAVKLVIVDLDDTMWNGVSGDLAEISGDMIEGWPIGVAEALVYLKKRGILLAIASKNDEARIREIWPTIFRGRFSLDEFAAVRINWRPKTENVREILNIMNLLPRSVVFIDDNPVERAAMKGAFPDMRVIGKNPYLIRRTLLWAPETQVAMITEESGRRTEMMQAQFSREEERASMSREEFLQAAAPVVTLFTIGNTGHPRFGRVLELVNKTNQFNTTGRRWKREEFQRHLDDGGSIWAFEVTDTYTSYGLVGVIMTAGDLILQWVMSCRVLGYQIEPAIMAYLVNETGMDRAAPVSGILIETDVNFPCRDLFSSCGFRLDGDRWVLPPETALTVPGHVQLDCVSAQAVGQPVG